MKLLRHGSSGAEKAGLLHNDGTMRDLTGLVPDIGEAVLSNTGLAMLRGIDPESLPVVPKATRLGPCVAGTGKFICIGLNYSDHAAETGATVPPGVGLGQKPPHYLKPGDVVELGVQSLGRQRQDVITD